MTAGTGASFLFLLERSVDANAVVQRQRELMKMVDAERQRLHAEEVNSKFQTDPDGDHRRYYSSTITKEQRDRERLVEDGDQLDVHISDSEWVWLVGETQLGQRGAGGHERGGQQQEARGVRQAHQDVRTRHAYP